MSAPLTKNDLRRRVQTLRDLIDLEAGQAAAQEIARRGAALARACVDPGSVVSAYWPLRREISTVPLLEFLAHEKFRTALPVMTGAAKPLRFRLWTPGDDLQKGPLGLSEPSDHAPEATPDFIFTPLVAFDARGGRIGYGGGNFDASLAFLRGRKNVMAAGLAFAVQEIEEVPLEPHDQRLDFVVTEERTLFCREQI